MNEVETALNNDMRLIEMATYHETHGLLNRSTPEQVNKRFVILKNLIKRGSFNIDELEVRIYTQFGVVTQTPEEQKFEKFMGEMWKDND